MYQLSDTVERKFIESIDIEDWEILTDSGWVDATQIHKTVKYEVYILTTEFNKELKGADTHILFDEDGNEIFLKDCIPGVTSILTKDGPELVTSVVRTGEMQHMYDITVDHPNHRYYTNDILSHNTTTVAAVIAWCLLFNKEYTIACLAHKQDQAIEIIDRVKTIYENLPLWLQHGIIAWNKKSIELENKSEVFAAATSSGSVRGQTINFVYADEFAIIETNLQEEFFTGTFPTISSGTESKFVISSTPRGFNLFYKIWTDAVEKRSDFVPIEINYWDVPGRTPAWAEKERKRIGDAKFRQEYETEFQGSSNTLIDGKKLGMITYVEPIMKDPEEHLHIFEQPVPGRQYVMSVDVSEGVGGDYSTFSVIDVSEVPYRIVATYANDMITTLMFPNVIFDVAQYFNSAYVVIEANTVGAEVANILHYDLEYENVLSSNIKSKKGELDETPRSYLGIKTTKKTKHLGCSNLKLLVEQDQLVINDFRVFYELSRFIRKGSSFQAEQGEHDDLVMNLVMFAYLTTQNSFKELTNTDLRLAMNQRKIHEQENLPVGIWISSDIENEVKELPLSEFDRWLTE